MFRKKSENHKTTRQKKMKLRKGTVYSFKTSSGVSYFMIISDPEDRWFKEICLSNMSINRERVESMIRDISERRVSFLNTDKAK